MQAFTSTTGSETPSSNVKAAIGQWIKCNQPPAAPGPQWASHHGCQHHIAICLAAVRSLPRKGNQISASSAARCELDYDSSTHKHRNPCRQSRSSRRYLDLNGQRLSLMSQRAGRVLSSDQHRHSPH